MKDSHDDTGNQLTGQVEAKLHGCRSDLRVLQSLQSGRRKTYSGSGEADGREETWGAGRLSGLDSYLGR